MTKKQFANEKRYQAAVAVARNMLKNDVITDEDYRQILTILAAKYRPFFASI